MDSVGFVVSVLLEHLEYLGEFGGGLAINGAHLAASRIIQEIVNSPDVEWTEIFVPPICMTPTERLAAYASAVLTPERKGQGRLRFYPFHSIPEVWADGQPRVLFTVDIGGIVRDRYLRDRFARGPMPISCDVHALGANAMGSLLRTLAEGGINDFDTFLCASTANVKALQNWLQLAPGKAQAGVHRIDLLAKAVDTSAFLPPTSEQKRKARKKLGWPEDKVIALYLGRVTPNDKADLLPLLTAFAAVSGEDHVLAICGNEEAPGYYRRLLLEGQELGDRLILQPKVSPARRPLFYQAADLFVFPGDTIQETFGLTVAEAMSTSLPVIASDWDGFRDTVIDGVTGYLVPTVWIPGNDRVQDLSPATSRFTDYCFLAQSVWLNCDVLEDRLRELLCSEDKRADMGRAGRERAEANYGWPPYMKGLLAIWADQMSKAKAEPMSVKESRRANAAIIGLPTPYESAFSHYATRRLDPANDIVALTPFGLAVAQKREGIGFYDETLVLIHPELIDRMIHHVNDRGGRATVNVVCSEAGKTSPISNSDVLFHLALLLKRGVFKLES